MSTITYGSRPKFTLNWSNTAASYVIITYTGNAIVGTGTTRTSGAQTGSSWTSGDLSLNATYTFTLTPYNQAGAAGTARTMSVNTTPSLGGSLSVGISTTSGTQITWNSGSVAGSNVSYVRIYRQITSPYTGSVEDICAGTYISSSPYYDNDISGNATYTYTVYPYDSTFNATNAAVTTFSVSTSAAAARDLSYTFLDSSSVKISFTLPKNAYSSSYYYQLNAVYSGTTTSVTGTTSPLWVKNLSNATTYTCYILTYLDGTLSSTSNAYNIKTSGISYTIGGSGTYTKTGNYLYFTSGTSTITFDSTYSLSVLIVGGGGAGGRTNGQFEGGGGGGAGSLGVGTVSFSENTTYTVIIGSGGTADNQSSTTASSLNGSRTYVTYNSGTTYLSAGGGGGGGCSNPANSPAGTGASGGSGGGGAGSNGDNNGGSYSSTNNTGSSLTFYRNTGGLGQHYNGSGGGGGAGGSGYGSDKSNGASGGSGYMWIDNIYYAGGGGGSASYNNKNGGNRTSGQGGSGNAGCGGYFDSNLNYYSATDASSNRGSGGGGGGYTLNKGGNGGSGVFAIYLSY
jgi:hypothetical protein